MQKYKNGFCIVAFLVYLLIFTLLVGISCHSILTFLLPAMSSMRLCSAQIELHTVGDAFVNDVRTIKNNMYKLHSFSDTKVVWKNDYDIIAWCIKNNVLKKYCIKKDTTKKKIVSIVCNAITGKFAVDYKGDSIVGVMLTLSWLHDHSNTLDTYVALV